MRRAAATRARARRTRAIAALAQSLAHLNPQAVLERGYAIVTTADGAIVEDARKARASATTSRWRSRAARADAKITRRG